MGVTAIFMNCLYCGKPQQVFRQEIEEARLSCEDCGRINDLEDPDVEFYEFEFGASTPLP